jgi:two-component system LytT family sensor kinase
MTRWLIQLLYENRSYRFWFCQLIGWGGYSLVTFLSITLVDNLVSWSHIAHISLSAVLGMLTSWPLRPLYRQTFGYSISRRLVIATVAIVVLSGVWTVLRVTVFALMIDKPAIWDEFNYWYFGSLFVFLTWTVLYYGITYYELLTLEHQKLLQESALRSSEKFKRLQAETSAREAQLQMLRYQLNPHFLFNTFNAISSLVQTKENKKAQEIIQLLSDFLRHSLDQDGVENVSLEQELESLMLYLNIEKARFEDRLTLQFDIEPEARQASVPGMILQPIIENAMKYAISQSEEGGTVSVSASVSDKNLLLQVSDTGPGDGATKISQGRGIGLRNTLQRLEAIYASEYAFEINEEAATGFTVRLRFPFQRVSPQLEDNVSQAELTPCAS